MLGIFSKKWFKISLSTIVISALLFQFFPLQKPILTPKKALAYRYPTICQPRVPYYHQAFGKSEALHQSCYYFKRLEDSASHLLKAVKKIREYSDPFNKCNPIYNCYADCSLEMPDAKCWLDIGCLIYPPLCTAEGLAAIQNIVTILNNFIDIYNSIMQYVELGKDLVEFFETTVDIFQTWQDFQEEVSGIDLSKVEEFADKLYQMAEAKGDIRKEIDNIKGRLEEMRHQVEVNLATNQLGLQATATQEIFTQALRTSVETISSEEFWQKFVEMEKSIYKIDNFISQPENGLASTTREELLEKIGKLESSISTTTMAMEEVRNLSEDLLLENILIYLAEGKGALSLTTETLLFFENQFLGLEIPPEMEEPFFSSTTAEVSSILQSISETKTPLQTVLAEISRIEQITGMSIEKLAELVPSTVEEAKQTILEEINGKVDQKNNTLIKPIWISFQTINENFKNWFVSMNNSATSIEEKIDQLKYQSLSKKAEEIRSLTENSLDLVNKILPILKEIKERAEKGEAFKKEEVILNLKGELLLGRILFYLSALKSNINSLSSNLESLSVKLPELEAMITTSSRIPNDDKQYLIGEIENIQEKVQLSLPPSRTIANKIQTIEMLTGMDICKVATLYLTLDALQNVQDMFEDTKEKISGISVTLDSTEEGIKNQCQEVETDLSNIKERFLPCQYSSYLATYGGWFCAYCYWRRNGSGCSGWTIGNCRNVTCTPQKRGLDLYRDGVNYNGKITANLCKCGDWPAPFVKHARWTCNCDETIDLYKSLPYFGIEEDYIIQTRDKIDELNPMIDQLETAALEAMKVMNFLKALKTVQELIVLAGKWSSTLEEIKKDLAGEIEGIPKLQLPDISATAGCKIQSTGTSTSFNIKDWLKDKCLSLPAKGVYDSAINEGKKREEQGGRVCPDLTTLQNQIRNDFGIIRAMEQKIYDIKSGASKEFDFNPQEDVEPLLNLAQQIFDKAALSWAWSDALTITSNKCICGSSKFDLEITLKVTTTTPEGITTTATTTKKFQVDLCKSLYCFPFLANLLKFDCDWVLLRPLLEGLNLDKEIINGLCENNGICEIPMPLNAIVNSHCLVTWIFNFLMPRIAIEPLENLLNTIP